MKCLVTGGAGFIGSHLVDQLIEEGHEVVILDNLDPQVHSAWLSLPPYLNKNARFVLGDVRSKKKLKGAMEGVEVVFHEAASVGVEQSMSKIFSYVDNNCGGTACLLDFLANEKHGVKKIIVAGSTSAYGEGSYFCVDCGEVVDPEVRSEEQMNRKDWELRCPLCRSELNPFPTCELKRSHCKSIYAITKKNQEEMVLCFGKAYGIPAVSLRYFNVYGPRQSLNNPYTGLAANFMNRIKNNQAPLIYEDGNQTRDFVFVEDIARANLLAMNSSNADFEVFNVGTGSAFTVLDMAKAILREMGSDLVPEITGRYRKGDVRHSFADISKIRKALGFEPKTCFSEGIKKLVEWNNGV